MTGKGNTADNSNAGPLGYETFFIFFQINTYNSSEISESSLQISPQIKSSC